MGTFVKHGRWSRKLSALALALAFALGLFLVLAHSWSVSAQTAAQDVLEKNVQASPATPITIYSESAATWVEKNDRVYLLQGNVKIEQGSTVITMGRGAIWVDLRRKADTGAYYLHAYGEDGIQLRSPEDNRKSLRGMFAMTTTGEVRVKVTASKLVDQNLTNDSVYERAFAERQRVGAEAAKNVAAVPIETRAPLQLVQGVDPLTPPPPPMAPMAPVGPPPAPPAAAPPDAFPPSPPVVPPSVPPAAVLPAPAQAPAQAPANPGFFPDPAVPPPTFAPQPTPPQQPPGPPPFFGPATTPPPPLPPLAPTAPPKQFSVRPRSSEEIKVRKETLANGETVWIVPSPVIVTILDPANKLGVIDIEADRMVFWTKEDGKALFETMKGPGGETSQRIEFYLAGNVEMRTRTKKEEEILRCDQLYYDASRNVAVATKADLELKVAKAPNGVHIRSEEILQLNAKTFKMEKAELYESHLPSDPALIVHLQTVTIEEIEYQKKNIFGYPLLNKETGEPRIERDRYFYGKNMWVDLNRFPVFYFPYIYGNVEDPLGPLESLSGGNSNIFGFTIQSSWDLYQLLGIDRPQGTQWRLWADYYSMRGAALGTQFSAKGTDLFGFDHSTYEGFVKAYGLQDHGSDLLGGGRGQFYFPAPPGTQVPIDQPDWRGRVLSRWNVQNLPEGFSVKAALGLISDVNFVEQYYQNEWLTDYNNETYVYLKQQQGIWAWDILAEPRLRTWVTDPQKLPEAQFNLIGQKFLNNIFTFDTRADATYSLLRTPTPPGQPAYLPTDVPGDYGRFDLYSTLAAPFTVGAFRLMPYIKSDFAYYTADVNGDGLGRAYGGVGMSAQIPFSRLFPDVCSEMFNVDSLYHKISFMTNYYYARSSANYTQFPQIDRMWDDTSDQAMRDLRYRQIFINPSNAAFLTTNPLVDPQTYAIRRLIDNRIDTIDSMQVVQFGIDQRLQTRRGIAASEHAVDWMTLNLGASLFPQANRDNFGNSWGILEYDYVWNIGDRTALFSNGWMEPTGHEGPRFFTFGGQVNRPDGTNLSLGYRQIDPLNSKAVTASLNYSFSRKYQIRAATVWDFGTEVQTYSMGFTRVGTDVQLSLGFSYTQAQSLNNLNFTFEIIPNVIKSNTKTGAGMGNMFSTMGR